MARGRTLFSEHRLRAASVPVGDLSYPDRSTASKLQHIRSDIAHDTEALMSASKRHDRDFLHQVQSKLASPSTFIKTPPTLNHNRARGPPPSRSAYYAATAVSSHAAPSSAPRDLRRRTWYGPSTNRVDDYEVAAYLATPTRPPYVSRALRAGSVPPVLASTATVPRWFPGSHVRGSSVPRWAPSSYRTYGSGRSYIQSHPDREDTVVGIAPTTQYGDIVIGIPYRKQFMYDVQHGLDAAEDYPRIPVATRVTSPHFAYRSSSLLRPYEDVDISPYQYSGSRYSSPSYGARSSVSWYPSYSQPPPQVSYSPSAARFSTIGYPTRASSARYAPTEYDLDLYGSKIPKDSFSRLRLGSAEPYHSQELAPTRSHGTSHDFRGTGATLIGLSGSHSLPAPVPSAAPTGATTPRYSKPQISETRQRVRNLLCKTKKDPHYFDD